MNTTQGNKLITQQDRNNLEKIRQLIYAADKTDENALDYENMELLETFDRVRYNIINGHKYWQNPGSNSKYYYAICGKCGWEGSSEYLWGGHAIADTGDYGDVYCPVCNSTDIQD